jgi:nucleotide-binding universal stress UspA family protein
LQKGENVSETQSKVDLLKELFHGKANFQFQITSGDLEQKIEEFSKNTHADVLAMIHHHKSFLTRLRERNVIKDVAKEIHTPLLVLMKNE